MSIDRLKSSSHALHSLTPEGRHVPHRYGSATDKAALKAVADAETDAAVRMVRREQLSKFVVVSAEHAPRHADTLERKLSAADALIAALGLSGSGRPGVIAEADARRYLVKVFRELRHKIAAGSPVDLAALSESVSDHLRSREADHLGVEAEEQADPNLPTILAALTAEHDAFSAEHSAAKEELGVDHIFHEDIGFIDARLQA